MEYIITGIAVLYLITFALLKVSGDEQGIEVPEETERFYKSDSWKKVRRHKTMVHELKTRPDFFKAVANGTKRFEVRRDDRNFKIGDFLALREYDSRRPNKFKYTGRSLIVAITYILRSEEFCKEGFVILGIDSGK